MGSEQIWQRYEILGTQVITRDTGKRLGIVSELLVDVDRREVVALGLRDNPIARVLPGLSITSYLYLESIRQIGDVVLVDSAEVIEDINPDRYSALINSEVVTENEEPLGRVRGFKFNIESRQIEALVIASIGLPMIPDSLISTYELPVEEIASTGPSRIVVFEGAEERLLKITEGVMEKLGLGVPPWEREDEREFYAPATPAENQLGTGEPLRTPAPSYREPYRAARPVMESPAWDDDNWNEPELEPIRQPARPQIERRYYEAEVEEDNWSEATGRERYAEKSDPYSSKSKYKEPEYREPPYSKPEPKYEPDDYEDEEEDVWADDVRTSYPPLNIPEKKKQPEYEEETNW
jgi:sporulation protein YlmC with PRC-barrel domain